MRILSRFQWLALGLAIIIFGSWLLPFVSAALMFGLSWLLPCLYVCIGVGWLLVHYHFALAVMRDGRRLHEQALGPLFVEPHIWGLATLVGGLAVVLLYWIFHYSTLRR